MMSAGTYFGHLVGNGVSETKNGTPFVWLEYDITYVMNDSTGQWEKCDRCKRSVDLYLSEKAMPFSNDKLNAIGFNGDFGNMQFDPQKTSEGTQLVCKHESGANGNMYEKWDFPFAGSERKPAGTDLIRQLNAKYRQYQQPKPPQAKPTPSQPLPAQDHPTAPSQGLYPDHVSRPAPASLQQPRGTQPPEIPSYGDSDISF